MSQFKATGITNLIRHVSSGTYYLQAKVDGKKVRRSLRTKDKAVARYRLGEALERERCEARGVTSMRGSRGSWGELVEGWVRYQDSRPDIKPKTKAYYADLGRWLLEGIPGETDAGKVSGRLVEGWWSREGRERSASVANGLLSAARGVWAWGIREGLERGACPFGELRKVKGVRRLLRVISRGDFERLLVEVESVGKRVSAESRDLIEFLAFTGMRIGEVRVLCWEDVGDEVIRVTGGEAGTKSGLEREVPIVERVGRLLGRRRPAGVSPGERVFSIASPKKALGNGLSRLGLPHMRVHDLRHFFATQCVESGVDLPTVARWLGHQDGGVLAMRIYGHIRDDHSREMARRIG